MCNSIIVEMYALIINIIKTCIKLRTTLVLKPAFNVSELIGPVVALGFEGGHGTAAGVATSFDTLGFPEGKQLTLCSATIGLLSGVVFGTLAVKWVRCLIFYYFFFRWTCSSCKTSLQIHCKVQYESCSTLAVFMMHC